jgi:hypothetical protein
VVDEDSDRDPSGFLLSLSEPGGRVDGYVPDTHFGAVPDGFGCGLWTAFDRFSLLTQTLRNAEGFCREGIIEGEHRPLAIGGHLCEQREPLLLAPSHKEVLGRRDDFSMNQAA